MTLRVQFVASTLIAFALPAAAAAADRMRGLEAREARLEWALKHDARGRPGKRATRACQVFAGHAVLSTDEGEMGVDDLTVRVRPRGMAPAEVCGPGFQGREVRWNAAGAVDPVGVVGKYLVAVYPDGYGVLGSFTLFELSTGAKVFEDQYAYTEELSFEPGASGVTMTYWAMVEPLVCVPRRGEAACWARIREKNGIPSSVPQPDCEAVLARDPSALRDPARSLQVAVHVRVPRLSRRDATYLPDEPSCDLTP